MSKPRLGVIIASVRPQRLGEPIGHWFVDFAREHGAFEVEVLDLREIGLPLTTDEANHPRLQQYSTDAAKRWSQTVSSLQAFVIVLPEYNHGYPAAIKNALDLVLSEWFYKPVGFVSYGGISGGLRAVAQLKQTLPILRMVPAADAVVAPFAAQQVTDGVFEPTDIQAEGATNMLDEMAELTEALRGMQKPPTSS